MTVTTSPALASRQQTVPFEVWQLLLLRAWADFHGLEVRIDLAGQVGGVECEELVTLVERHSGSRSMLWRSADGLMLRSAAGLTRQFEVMADVLAAIIPAVDDDVTDIDPARAATLTW